MKKLFTILCFLMFTVTVSAKSQQTQKTTFDEKITYTTDAVADDVIVQDLRGFTQGSKNEQKRKGHNIYKNESYRYNSGITSSGYSSYIKINKSIIGNTKCSKIENCQNITKESRQHYQSGLCLSRIGNGSKNLQGNCYTSTRNYNQSTGNHYGFAKTDSNYVKAFCLRRYCSGGIDCSTDVTSFFKEVENLINKRFLLKSKSKYHG